MTLTAGELRLCSGRIVTPSGTVGGEVLIRDGRIEAVGPRGEPRAGAVDTVVELGERWIVPGYVDTHVHGGGGAQCNTSDPAEIDAVARFHAAHGTTALLATIVPAPLDQIEEALEAISRCTGERQGGARVLGAHLEGPFLSPARPGALDASLFLGADARVAERLLGSGGGNVRVMTFAPELPGALEVVRMLVDAGVVASIGHSDATYEQAYAAVLAGACAATHTFNAMRPIDHREPGVLGAVLDLAQVSCELICDGVHVRPAALRLAYRAKGPAGVRLVTDAIEAAGMPDGEYRLGAAAVSVSDGRVTLPASGAIAGSTLTIDAAVRNAVRFLGIPLHVAVALASANPARLIGVDHRKGAIAPGMDADIVVLDEELLAYATLVGGLWVHGPAGLMPAGAHPAARARR